MSGELGILNEEAYELKVNGKIGTQTKFYQLQPRMRFIISAFARLYGNEHYVVDVSTQGWEQFDKALRIRHRITHPKDVESFKITDEEIAVVESAKKWFADTIKELLDIC